MAGLLVSSIEEVSMELVGKTNNIKDTYTYSYGTWLPKSPYVNPYAYDFEYYDERNKGNTHPATEIDIYIPIRKRSS